MEYEGILRLCVGICDIMVEIECSNCNKVIGEGRLYEEAYCYDCIEDVAYFKKMQENKD